ncbi:MAG: response regulator, partial [Myxococcota bacterium]|nr:response regulator [Myxococcota bacterium]
DGTEAYCRIREILPDIPIVFCTGHSDAHRIAVPEVLTRAPVVKKPFRAAHLIQAVRSALAE